MKVENRNDLEHNDHIWLLVDGEAWAIHSIDRPPTGHMIFALWRGYYPNIEGKVLVTDRDYPWDRYCQRAAEYLEASQPLETLLMRHKDIRA